MGAVHFGNSVLMSKDQEPKGDFINFNGTQWYRIEHYDSMPAFFMSITNPDNIWMFISSTGGLTCGRESSENALFPYLTVDKVTESITHTGALTLLLIDQGDHKILWKPLDWSTPQVYDLQRNLLKSINGDCILFEEFNHTLGLVFRMSWEASPEFGIHRHCELTNLTPHKTTVHYLDGVRNLLPAGATVKLQTTMSTLLDGYKRNELDQESGLGIYALSATLTDLAEPSESLQATTLWSYGLDDSTILLSELQLQHFVRGKELLGETDIKGQRGAYFLTGTRTLEGNASQSWGMCAELKQDHSSITDLRSRLINGKPELVADLMSDIQKSRKKLDDIIKINDGHQVTGSLLSDVHHRANVLFNCMRGGYFIQGYTINAKDFYQFAQAWNRSEADRHSSWLKSLPETLRIDELQVKVQELGSPVLLRLALEYLPLTFSRRHGDPSRPWNQFFIRTTDQQGNPVLGYQGNWRDIFQNWEALCLSYPLYLPSVITKFLNATTIDGYNPYRISDHGIDWESPDPEDPWSNIGYWSDHQIIYLVKLLEHCRNYLPEAMNQLNQANGLVFADVPYRIKPLESLLQNPFSSIEFDHDHHEQIMKRVSNKGADGRLVHKDAELLTTGFTEKLLILLLAKVANYVPGGGIWMNTQRPEWNDANNALAGWGVSRVTLAYLIRYLESLTLVVKSGSVVELHKEVANWLEKTRKILQGAGPAITDPKARLTAIKALGQAGSEYRSQVYRATFQGEKVTVDGATILFFLEECKKSFESTMTLRTDGLYESYQVLMIENDQAQLRTLYPMLEGQVAGLSVAHQDPGTLIQVVQNLRTSSMYQEDQHSYMLYPNRELPGYLKKNCIDPQFNQELTQLSARVNLNPVVQKDSQGVWHFSSTFRNVEDLYKAAGSLDTLVQAQLAIMFEQTFNHAEFTGRSGTFFAFEGLGSIYWHMVSKLMLAVQEQVMREILTGNRSQMLPVLKAFYSDVRAGLGFNKTPGVYGAFPTDPYSHSPWGMGAKQPGMTGQVKEEIITRFAELGLVVFQGAIHFIPELILEDQWDTKTKSLKFTFCTVPITIKREALSEITVEFQHGTQEKISGKVLSPDLSREIFSHSGRVKGLVVRVSQG